MAYKPSPGSTGKYTGPGSAYRKNSKVGAGQAPPPPRASRGSGMGAFAPPVAPPAPPAPAPRKKVGAGQARKKVGAGQIDLSGTALGGKAAAPATPAAPALTRRAAPRMPTATPQFTPGPPSAPGTETGPITGYVAPREPTTRQATPQEIANYQPYKPPPGGESPWTTQGSPAPGQRMQIGQQFPGLNDDTGYQPGPVSKGPYMPGGTMETGLSGRPNPPMDPGAAAWARQGSPQPGQQMLAARQQQAGQPPQAAPAMDTAQLQRDVQQRQQQADAAAFASPTLTQEKWAAGNREKYAGISQQAAQIASTQGQAAAQQFLNQQRDAERAQMERAMQRDQQERMQAQVMPPGGGPMNGPAPQPASARMPEGRIMGPPPDPWQANRPSSPGPANMEAKLSPRPGPSMAPPPPPAPTWTPNGQAAVVQANVGPQNYGTPLPPGTLDISPGAIAARQQAANPQPAPAPAGGANDYWSYMNRVGGGQPAPAAPAPMRPPGRGQASAKPKVGTGQARKATFTPSPGSTGKKGGRKGVASRGAKVGVGQTPPTGAPARTPGPGLGMRPEMMGASNLRSRIEQAAGAPGVPSPRPGGNVRAPAPSMGTVPGGPHAPGMPRAAPPGGPGGMPPRPGGRIPQGLAGTGGPRPPRTAPVAPPARAARPGRGQAKGKKS